MAKTDSLEDFVKKLQLKYVARVVRKGNESTVKRLLFDNHDSLKPGSQQSLEVKEYNTGLQHLQWMPFRRRPLHLFSSTRVEVRNLYSTIGNTLHRYHQCTEMPHSAKHPDVLHQPTKDRTGDLSSHVSHRMLATFQLHHTCNPPTMHANTQYTASTSLTIPPSSNSCFCKAGVGSQPPTPASISHSRLDIFSTVVPGRIY